MINPKIHILLLSSSWDTPNGKNFSYQELSNTLDIINELKTLSHKIPISVSFHDDLSLYNIPKYHPAAEYLYDNADVEDLSFGLWTDLTLPGVQANLKDIELLSERLRTIPNPDSLLLCIGKQSSNFIINTALCLLSFNVPEDLFIVTHDYKIKSITNKLGYAHVDTSHEANQNSKNILLCGLETEQPGTYVTEVLEHLFLAPLL